MWKIIKYGLIGWLVLSILTFPFYWPFIRMFWVFLPMVESPNYEPPATAIEARLQDIDYLSKLTEYDRSFSDAAKLEFTNRLATIESNAEDMSEGAFYLAIAEAVALADNGHTNVSYRPQYSKYDTIGARLYAFSDGLYVLRAAPEHVGALGHRVVAIDDVPIETLQSELGKFKGGNAVWRTLYSTLLIESPPLLEAAGYAVSPDQIDLTLETPAGDLERVTFPAISAENASDQPWRAAWETLLPETGNPVYEGWSHVLEPERGSIPDYLATPWQPLSYPMDGNGLYIRALRGFAAGDQSIKSAYKEMLAEHPKGSLDYLVVDFRLHDGGDYTKSMAFAKAAPKRVKEDGDIYIITGPNTFSAAIVTTAMLKYYAGDRGVIIGEQMGDREQFWAERGTSFRLPNSGYYINYATGYHDWENGCKGEPYCYTMNEMYEVPAGSLAPAVTIPLSFAEFQRGEDVVMDWVKAQRQ